MKTTNTIWMISRRALLTSLATMLITIPAAGIAPAKAAQPGGTPAPQSVKHSVTYNGRRSTWTPASVAPVKMAAATTPMDITSDASGFTSPEIDAPSVKTVAANSSPPPTAHKQLADESVPVQAPAPATPAPLAPAAVPQANPSNDGLANGGPVVDLDFVEANINDVLKALAVQTGANIVASADVKGSVTVSLSKVSLEQALDIIAKTSGFAWAKTGNTYVVGTAAGVAALTGQGAAPGQQPVTAVISYLYANPDDLSSILKNRFPDLKITAGTSINGQKVGAGTKALILTGDPTFINQAKDLIAQVEASLAATAAQSQMQFYKVKYASMGDLINLLNGLVPGLVVTPGPSQGFNAKAPSAAASAMSTGSSSSGTSGSGGSPGATGASQASLTGPTVMILSGSAGDMAKALNILDQVDVRPTQILFETKVTEISENDINQLGLNWNFTGATTTIGEIGGTSTTTGTTTNAAGATTTSTLSAPNGTFPGNILKLGTFARSPITNLAAVSLDAILNDGHSKLLADPNIAALDGQAAQVFIGNTVNYIQSITQTTTGENITTASVQVGVILRVTGKVGDDGYVTLNIHPEVSSIQQFVSVPGGGSLPDVSTRYADTTIRVKSGQTIAIGGLIQQNDLSTVIKVPILGDIPLLGYLFRDTQKNTTRDEVVFFLKTSIIND